MDATIERGMSNTNFPARRWNMMSEFLDGYFPTWGQDRFDELAKEARLGMLIHRDHGSNVSYLLCCHTGYYATFQELPTASPERKKDAKLDKSKEGGIPNTKQSSNDGLTES